MSGTTITLPTAPAPVIDLTGCHVPQFQDYLDYLIASYQAINGADTYLGNDSQDAQLLGIFSLVLSDQASACLAAYNSFSPATAQGVGLSNNVKINGMSRKTSTKSTVDQRIVGNAGIEILAGVVGDGHNRWNLPASVVIPDEGEIIVTATADAFGDIRAVANTIIKIETPVAGWQTTNNPSNATPGQPIETDAILRRRQTDSTSLPGQVILDGIIGGLSTIPNVSKLRAYENDTDETDANGIPSHSISFVIEGGDVTLIAQTIATKKPPGTGTYGTTAVTVVSSFGVPYTIRYYRPTYVPITVHITIHNLFGFTTNIGTEIINSVIAAINAMNIGDDVLYTRLFIPAQLLGPYSQAAASTDPLTFELVSILIARSGSPVAADVNIGFNEAASCDVAHVTLTVV